MKTILSCGALALSLSSAQAVLTYQWDFEGGEMGTSNGVGWNVIDVFGSNDTFSTGPLSVDPTAFNDASIQGDWIVRTWNRNDGIPTPATGTTSILADANTGAVRTDPFTLPANATITLLRGGGNHPWDAGLDPDDVDPGTGFETVNATTFEREVAPGDWEVLFSATGANSNSLIAGTSWDASAFAGETVRFGIYDLNNGGWGWTGVDDIQINSDPIPEPSALGLGVIAAAGLLMSRRRRKR